MKNYITEAQNDINELDKLIFETKNRVAAAPAGTLKIKRNGGYTEYYRRVPKAGGKAIYLKKSDEPLTVALAQKDYDIKILNALTLRRDALSKLSSEYPSRSLESIYEELCPERQSMVKPLEITDAQYEQLWKMKPYTPNGFYADDASFYTGNGERVRSKSEVLIADILSRAGLPYKYECPLILGNVTVYPDFTILDVKRRREIFLEHFGRMDDPEYALKFVRKVSLYESNGFFAGERLLMTFEAAKAPLDIPAVHRLIEHTFLL